MEDIPKEIKKLIQGIRDDFTNGAAGIALNSLAVLEKAWELTLHFDTIQLVLEKLIKAKISRISFQLKFKVK